MKIVTNFPQFDAGLALEADTAEKMVVRLVRAVHMDLGGRLIRMTPKLTGYAARGWTPSVHSPSSWLPPPGLERYDTATPKEAAAALLSLRLGDTAWWTDNVVYIERLNDGWSQQAPAQFVELAMQESVMVLQRAA
jgi:hypothetical protein